MRFRFAEHNSRWLASALIGVTFAGSARAAGFPDETYAVLPCRPTIACTADLVPPGSVEIETGYLRRKLPGDAGVAHTLPLLLKLSILHDVQLQLATNTAYSSVRGRQRAFDDLAAGVKVRLIRQTSDAPAFGLSLLYDELAVPGFEARARGGQLTAYVTKDFGWLHVDLNLAVNLWWIAGDPATQRGAALAFSTTLGRGFGVMAEGYVFSSAAPVGPKDGGLLGALTYAPMPYLMFDVGGDVGLFPSSRAYSVFAGLTVILVDLWDELRGEPRASDAAPSRSRAARAWNTSRLAPPPG